MRTNKAIKNPIRYCPYCTSIDLEDCYLKNATVSIIKRCRSCGESFNIWNPPKDIVDKMLKN